MAGIGTATVAKETKVNSIRVWLFGVLVLIGGGGLLYTWFRPWWNLDIEELGYDMIRLHPWGLEMDERLGSFTILLKGADMPAWFGPMMWALLGACMLALLAAIIFGAKEIKVGGMCFSLGTFLVSGVGLFYLVVAIGFAVYASMRMGSMYNAPLQGRAAMDLGGELHSWVTSHLLPGYFMTYPVAIYLLLVGLLRDLIVGEL